MKTISLINAIKRIGIKVEKRTCKGINKITGLNFKNHEFFSFGSEYKVHWYDQEGYAVCVQVQRVNDYNDLQTDYFPGYFAKTIKEVIEDLKK